MKEGKVVESRLDDVIRSDQRKGNDRKEDVFRPNGQKVTKDLGVQRQNPPQHQLRDLGKLFEDLMKGVALNRRRFLCLWVWISDSILLISVLVVVVVVIDEPRACLSSEKR